MTPEKLKKLALKVADRHAPMDKNELDLALRHKLGTLTDKTAKGIEITAHGERVAFGDTD